jgi:spore maturation protein CgeB
VRIKHIAIVYSPHFFSTRDVALGYSKALHRLGYHVIDIDYAQIWEDWCMVRGLDKKSDEDKRWLFERASGDVLFEAVKCDPDLVLVIDGSQLHEVFWKWIGRFGFKVAMAMTDCPYHDVAHAYLINRCDYPFANDRGSARKMGIPYLPMAYNKEIHHPMLTTERFKSDVVFVGSGFQERIEILEQVDWTGIDLKLLGYFNLAQDSPLTPYYDDSQAGVANHLVAQYYCGAKLVLNIDRTSINWAGTEHISGRESVGPRIYEAAACAATIVSQNEVPELEELLGGSYLSFSTPEELQEIVHTWVSDDMAHAREELGLAARERIQGHSYEDRARALLQALTGDHTLWDNEE